MVEAVNWLSDNLATVATIAFFLAALFGLKHLVFVYWFLKTAKYAFAEAEALGLALRWKGWQKLQTALDILWQKYVERFGEDPPAAVTQKAKVQFAKMAEEHKEFARIALRQEAVVPQSPDSQPESK